MAVTINDTRVDRTQLSNLLDWLRGVGQDALANQVQNASSMSEAARMVVDRGFSVRAVAAILDVEAHLVEQAVTTTDGTTSDLDRVAALVEAANRAPLSVTARQQLVSRIRRAGSVEDATRAASAVLDRSTLVAATGIPESRIAAMTMPQTVLIGGQEVAFGGTSRTTAMGGRGRGPTESGSRFRGTQEPIPGGGVDGAFGILPGQIPPTGGARDVGKRADQMGKDGSRASDPPVAGGRYGRTSGGPGDPNEAAAAAQAAGQPEAGFDPTGATVLVNEQGAPIVNFATGQPYYVTANGVRFTYDPAGNPVGLTDVENQWVDSQLPELPPYIGGFPENYSPDVEPSNRRKYGGRDVGPPRYREMDQWSQFGAMSPEYQATVQSALVRAGLLDEDAVRDVWTPQAANAMGTAMLMANAAGGATWIEVLQQLEQDAPTEEDEEEAARRRNPFITPVYRAPDKASMRDAVRTEFSRQLGRQVEDWEYGLFLSELSNDFRAQYESEVSAARMQYEAAIRAEVTEKPQGTGTVTAVDPFARLTERVMKLYEPEIEAERAEDELAINTSGLARSLAGIERLVGG